MTLINPFDLALYLYLPLDLAEWLGCLLMFGLVVAGLVRWREDRFAWGPRQWTLLIVLVMVVVMTTPFLGFRMPLEGALPASERPELPKGPPLLILSALPWMLAAGWLGVFPATLLAGLAGLMVALFDSHRMITPFIYAVMGLIFSVAVRQRYRTLLFKSLRHPVVTGLGLAVFYLPVLLFYLSLETTGAVVTRLDYGLTRMGAYGLALLGQLVIGGLLAELAVIGLPKIWGQKGPLIPSPAETSLQFRFYANIGPLVGLLLLVIMIGDWMVAENIAKQMLENQLAGNARVVAESIPYFLETGQNLISQFASNPKLLDGDENEAGAALEQQLRSVPYFRQLFLLDEAGNPVASYPATQYALMYPTPEEQKGFQLAVKGVRVQMFTVPPLRGESTAQVSFLAALQDENGKVKRILWGRTDLNTNPFTQPMLEALKEVTNLGGAGQIVDDAGKILYHPETSRVMTDYLGQKYDEPNFFDQTSSDGTRELVYYQPSLGRQWAIVLSVPARTVQGTALNMALPLLVMVILVTGFATVLLFLTLRMITKSMVTLAGEAGRIAQGQFDHPLPPFDSQDEVGVLRQSFEKMRLSLKARLDELNKLLQVSQGVAASLEMHEATQPILEAALSEWASSARIVLARDVVLDVHSDQEADFGAGVNKQVYAYLDQNILAMTRQHGQLLVTNTSRVRGFNFVQGKPFPSAMISVPLRHENRFYGVLWVAYDGPTQFPEEQIRFLNTLAGEAALAAANARLYASAEIGRQRLEAVLASTPDPVLVTDSHNQLLLCNPAVLQIPGLGDMSAIGHPINEVIDQPDLLEMLLGTAEGQPSREITFSNGHTYFVTISSVFGEGKVVGKVCILRDITHYKELDKMKSEFVATVSHDLRSPLSSMKGYATMLPIVGEMNEQQKSFVRKITTGVENMTRLVNNLLDLGRIEAGLELRLEMAMADEMIERVVSTYQLQAAQKNIQILTHLPVNTKVALEVDGSLLQQALNNLVENAVKYTPLNGQIVVSLQNKATTVVFSIKDTGIGIAPLDQQRLFEKFYRGTQREAYQQRGTGLGLAIVKSIAERHKGKVWVESILGKGSQFFLEIPHRQSKPDDKSEPLKS